MHDPSEQLPKFVFNYHASPPPPLRREELNIFLTKIVPSSDADRSPRFHMIRGIELNELVTQDTIYMA